MKRNWYDSLTKLESRGSVTEPGGLAGLAAAREVHQGQFWTPPEVVAFCWRVAGMGEPVAVDDGDRAGGKVRVLDNSFGSGRMFWPADPKRHILYGIEADESCGAAVQNAAKMAGFDGELVVGRLEEYRATHGAVADVAFVNPPFGLTWDGPNIQPYECNAYGKYGRRSSALSHRYAVAQALEWSSYVVAVVPRSFADYARLSEVFSQRLAAVYHLPSGAFRGEGAEVEVSVLAFGGEYRDEESAPFIKEEVGRDLLPSKLPGFEVSGHYYWGGAGNRLAHKDCGDGRPVVALPVTDDKKVRVCHNGRKVILKFASGEVQGRVLNHVYRELMPSRRSKQEGRIPVGVRYAGQGALDLENYQVQAEPVAAWRRFVASVESVGYPVQVDPAIERYIARKRRRYERWAVPFRHAVQVVDGGLSRWLLRQSEVVGVARETVGVKFSRYRTETVEAGQEVKFSRRGDGWSATINQSWCSDIPESLIRDKFLLRGFAPEAAGWSVVHGGLRESHPQQFAARAALARSLGLHRWCTWRFQFFDLVETSLKGGGVVAWDMGLGKARYALAQCILGQGEANLIVVEPHLVREMLDEIAKLKIRDTWQFIEGPYELGRLRKINLITYTRLKSAVRRHRPRQTYARCLRRRCHTVVCDEAHLLRNPQTEQSRAIHMLSPKTRYALSGTPIANYPRDVLPLLQWACGDGTAAQPFGMHHPYLSPANLQSMLQAKRGVDEFREMFVTLEWVTNEFAEDLRQGAKREIPRIKDVAGFRRLLAPCVKRRVMEEPEVAVNVKIPTATHHVREVEWDLPHLAYYYDVCQSFIAWYRRMSDSDRKTNLVAILAKMQGVCTACNYPQAGVAGKGPYRGETSKQRYAVDRLVELTAAGHKTIFLANNPATVEHVARRIGDRGVRSVVFHGGVSIAERVRVLDEDFRCGDVPVLCASKGVLQTGYNIHQADRLVAYDRSWTPKVEQQAFARVLRPQQRKKVEIECIHLAGSIDEYQAQMVEFKAESMAAGLDYGDDDPEREFLHVETILGRFVEEFESRVGLKMAQLVSGGEVQRVG